MDTCLLETIIKMYLKFQPKLGLGLHSSNPGDIASLGNRMKGHFLRYLVNAKQVYDLFLLGSVFLLYFAYTVF